MDKDRQNQAETGNAERREWSARDACAYWPDQRMHWAPVSWKDHLYDFNVFFNGTILANATGGGMNVNIPPVDQVFACELRIKSIGRVRGRSTCATRRPDARNQRGRSCTFLRCRDCAGSC